MGCSSIAGRVLCNMKKENVSGFRFVRNRCLAAEFLVPWSFRAPLRFSSTSNCECRLSLFGEWSFGPSSNSRSILPPTAWHRFPAHIVEIPLGFPSGRPGPNGNPAPAGALAAPTPLLVSAARMGAHHVWFVGVQNQPRGNFVGVLLVWRGLLLSLFLSPLWKLGLGARSTSCRPRKLFLNWHWHWHWFHGCWRFRCIHGPVIMVMDWQSRHKGNFEIFLSVVRNGYSRSDRNCWHRNGSHRHFVVLKGIVAALATVVPLRRIQGREGGFVKQGASIGNKVGIVRGWNSHKVRIVGGRVCLQ